MNRKTNKRPVTIITGCLGSGKTTLLSNVLKDTSMKDSAVLVNEFGKVGLDHHLLERVDENTVLLGGGCVCCSTREDLVVGLKDLLNRTQQDEGINVNRVIIETTGLADPAPILFTILTHPLLQHHYYIDNVIVTVDAANGHLHLDQQSESLKQVSVADKIVITKTDIATEDQVQSIQERIQTLNPTAEILRAVSGQIDPKTLFTSTDQLGHEKNNKIIEPSSPIVDKHISETRSISITFEEPLDWESFGLWLSMLLHSRGEDVLRVKGLLNVGVEGPVVLNGVQHIIHPPEHLDKWPSDDQRSRMIFIMKNIQPEQILDSLQAFQFVFGSKPNVLEMEVLV